MREHCTRGECQRDEICSTVIQNRDFAPRLQKLVIVMAIDCAPKYRNVRTPPVVDMLAPSIVHANNLERSSKSGLRRVGFSRWPFNSHAGYRNNSQSASSFATQITVRTCRYLARRLCGAVRMPALVTNGQGPILGEHLRRI